MKTTLLAFILLLFTGLSGWGQQVQGTKISGGVEKKQSNIAPAKAITSEKSKGADDGIKSPPAQNASMVHGDLQPAAAIEKQPSDPTLPYDQNTKAQWAKEHPEQYKALAGGATQPVVEVTQSEFDNLPKDKQEFMLKDPAHYIISGNKAAKTK